MKRKLRWVLAFLLLTGILAWLDQEWNLRSNFLLYLIQHTEQDLLLPDGQGDWVSVFSLEATQVQAQLRTDFADEGFRLSYLPVHRASDDNWIAFANALLSSRLQILEFSPRFFSFEVAFQPDFGLSSAREIQVENHFNFTINANYFDENQRPLGQVIHEEKSYNPHFPNWTGYFFVKNGKPYFGPRSLLDETPGEPEELLQGYPSLMKDHEVFNYVHLKSNPYFDGNTKTYRSLAGMRKDGTIVWILSGRGGILDVRELAALAQKLGLQHATLFDGGSSLQYCLDYKKASLRFQATSNRYDLSSFVGRLERVRPPVFIGVKSK